eukprot:Hpha_TRINITY_DN2076_c0_g1::TRINITY_DN2076_c0_g1_i1::g.83053::m.83053/K06934/K06934; uncharacterized protein
MREFAAGAVAGLVAVAAVWTCRTRGGRRSPVLHCVRFEPGVELRSALQQAAKERGIEAGCIVSCCGSLTSAKLRTAAASATGPAKTSPYILLERRLEIVSLVGTLYPTGYCHLHMAVSDSEGHVVGGHCLGDMIVFTTAEVVIADCTDYRFTRAMDERTGYPELCVERR